MLRKKNHRKCVTYILTPATFLSWNIQAMIPPRGARISCPVSFLKISSFYLCQKTFPIFWPQLTSILGISRHLFFSWGLIILSSIIPEIFSFLSLLVFEEICGQGEFFKNVSYILTQASFRTRNFQAMIFIVRLDVYVLYHS